MKRIKAPVTCSATSMAFLSMMSAKNGITKETKMKPIKIDIHASKDLLFKNDVRGI